MVLTLATVTLLLAACGSTEAAKPPSVDEVAAALSQSGSGGGKGGSGPESGPTRRSQGGSVTIDATWKNPQRGPGPIAFSVVMDTHSVDLDSYDFRKLAILRNDRGQEVGPDQWDAPPGGHHRSGTLSFPAENGSGSSMMGAGVKALELVIRDVAGVKERVLRWELPG